MPDAKKSAREIFRQTLASINIPRVMGSKLQFEGSRLIVAETSVDIAKIKQVHLVAIGKAAHAMVDGLSAILPAGISCGGVAAAPTKPSKPLPGLKYFAAGHPIPNANSWKAAEAILELLRTCDERTLVFFLLSGGGSALLELPLVPGMKLEDLQLLNRALVGCGAPIDAINTVRKHLSAVKGGRLAVAAGAAKKITLAVTDVPAGKEWALASGPTLPDPTTIADVMRILAEYDLREKLPGVVLQWLDAGKMPETPKASHTAFDNAHFALILGMHDLFHAAHHAAEARGYVTRCDNSTDDWPIEKAVDSLLAQLDEWRLANPGQRVALIADGEISSPVTGKGTGGRNSALVLACVQKIAGRKITVLSAGTDGIDGNSPAAGAVADGGTLERAKSLGMDSSNYFRQSDAFTFFNKLEDVIVTGPTNNNLRDLRILLAEP
jgi:glycerate 2-kinase